MKGMICKGCKKKRPYASFPKSGWGKCWGCQYQLEKVRNEKAL